MHDNEAEEVNNYKPKLALVGLVRGFQLKDKVHKFDFAKASIHCDVTCKEAIRFNNETDGLCVSNETMSSFSSSGPR